MSAARDNLRRERALHERLTPELRARILRRVRTIVRNRELAQDATQNALVALWRKPEALAPENERLLHRIVRCTALKTLRGEQRHAHDALSDELGGSDDE